MTLTTLATQSELEDTQYTALNDELTQEARGAVWGYWKARQECHGRLSRFLDYAEGRAGVPDIDDVSEELQTIARECVINMIGVVVNTFADGLVVVGYRSPSAVDNEPAWATWQRSGMDARQSEVIRPALTYGYSFASVLPDDDMDGKARMAAWSPLDVVADYDNPRQDLFPQRAMLLRAVEGGWSVLLVDDTNVQPGFVAKRRRSKVTVEDVQIKGESWEHGATWNGRPVCPVVRFVNERSSEDRPPRGEVEPLISKQRALNSASFCRDVNGRFGALQQMVIIGWETTKQTLLRTSAARAMSFEDHPDDLKVTKLSASPMEPFNAWIDAKKAEIATEAAIPGFAIGSASISNVSTDTAAMVEKAHQNKLKGKRDNSGESWEQLLRLAVVMDGGEEPSDSAEVVWRETEARSFAQVVDGIVKLASIPSDAGGVPVEDLLDLIPGMTQQRIDSIRDGIVRRRSGGMLTALEGMLTTAPAGTEGQAAPDTSETDQANVQKAKFEALGMGIRAGVEPDDAASRVGLTGIKFTGAVPVTLRLPTSDAAGLEVT